jgi:hypothetical protein
MDESFGAKYSDHREGNASDKSFELADAAAVREYIKKNWKALGITVIEEDVAWVHTSVAWIPDQTQLKIIHPKT